MHRYFKRELLDKGAIERRSMPKFFGAWIDKAMPSCVFTPTQVKVFKLPELQASPWYIECIKNYAPAEEEDEKLAAIAATAPASEDKVEDDDDDAVVEIAEPSSADKKRGKGKAVRSPAAVGSSHKAKPKVGAPATTIVSPMEQQVPPLDTATADRSHCQPSVTSVTFSPSQLQAQNVLGSRDHGIKSKVLIINDSLISLGERKLSQSTVPAALVDILDFAKKVPFRTISICQTSFTPLF